MNTSKTIITLLSSIFFSSLTFCQFQDNAAPEQCQKEEAAISQKQKLNFFIVSKRHKGKLDLASRFNIFRTKLKSLFRRKKFVSIIATNAQQASAKIQYR